MYAILGPDGLLEATTRGPVGDAVEEAYSSGAKNVIIDTAGDSEREENPSAKTVQSAHEQLRTAPDKAPLRIPATALDMDLKVALERLQATLWKLLRGDHSPTLRTLCLLAEALECRPRDLLP